MELQKILIKSGRVLSPANRIDSVADILINGSVIEAIGQDLQNKIDLSKNIQIIDAKNKLVVPGLIDMHTHLREPGQEAKEDFESGSRAAVAGGFTTVATMPNTTPTVDNLAVMRANQLRAQSPECKCKIEQIAALTKKLEGKELADIGDLATHGAVAFSNDGRYVENSQLLLNALDYLHPFKKIFIEHCEDEQLTKRGVMNEGKVSALLGLQGRPPVAEDIAVARDILLADYTQTHVHIAHLSTKKALEMVMEAKAKGYPVSCEVTAHHLTLSDEELLAHPFDTAYKVNPPLRTREDVEFLQNHFDAIDILVSDHSPHEFEKKDQEFDLAPSGFPGLETSFAVLYTQFKLRLPELIEKMTIAPAKLFGLDKDGRGSLTVGKSADIAIIDLNETWTPQPDEFFAPVFEDGGVVYKNFNQFYSRGSHSPFVGRKLESRVMMTLVDGKIVYQNGQIKE